MSNTRYGLSACLAAALMFIGGPVAAASSDGEVAAVNETVFLAARHIAAKPFDRVSAFTLTYAVLADGKMDASEKQLATVLAAEDAKGLKLKGPDDSPVTLPPPDAAARHVIGLLIAHNNWDDFWLKGDAPMRDLVAWAYLGEPTWKHMVQFVASKYHAAWKVSSNSNGFKPIRDTITQALQQGPDPKQDALLGNAKTALIYDAIKMVDNNERGAVPDFIYRWLLPEPDYRPFARGPVSVATRISVNHKSIGRIIKDPREVYRMQPMYTLTGYVGEGCDGKFFAQAKDSIVHQEYEVMLDYRRVKDVSFEHDKGGNPALLNIDGQCSVHAYDPKRPVDAAQLKYADCAMVKVDRMKVNKSLVPELVQAMREITTSCAR